MGLNGRKASLSWNLTGLRLFLSYILWRDLSVYIYFLKRKSFVSKHALEKINSLSGFSLQNKFFGFGLESSESHVTSETLLSVLVTSVSPHTVWPRGMKRIHRYFVFCSAGLGLPKAGNAFWVFYEQALMIFSLSGHYSTWPPSTSAPALTLVSHSTAAHMWTEHCLDILSGSFLHVEFDGHRCTREGNTFCIIFLRASTVT